MREDISHASLKDCYAILSLKEKGLSSEAKYFLIRVLFNYGRSNVNATVETLEKQIGMTDAVLKKTRDLLLEQNYLTRSLVHSAANDGSKRGRPREGFVVSASMIAKLDKIINEQKGLSKVMLAHTHRVAKLLFWKVDDGRLVVSFSHAKLNEKPHKKATKPLRPATRILLAILYSHADVCGAVRGISLSMLGQLSGMALDRLDSQLSKLSDFGYVWSRVSGVTGKFLFGRSVGSFFLNVFDDDLGRDIDTALLVMQKIEIYDCYNENFWGIRIFQDAKMNMRGLLSFKCLDGPNTTRSIKELEKVLASIRTDFSEERLFNIIYPKIEGNNVADLSNRGLSNLVFMWTLKFEYFDFSEIFKDAPLWDFSKFLQYKINEFASILLSQHWGEIAFDPMSIPETLIKKIKNDVYPVHLRKKTADLERAELIAEGLGLFLYRVSLESALLAKAMVITALKDNAAGLSGLKGATYTILPMQYKNERAKLTSVVVKIDKMCLQNKRCIFINDKIRYRDDTLNLDRQCYDGVYSVSNEVLEEFGWLRSNVIGDQ